MEGYLVDNEYGLVDRKSTLVDLLVSFIVRDIGIYGDRKRMYLCFGTPLIPGDTVGPMVGTLIKDDVEHVYGDVDRPILATNVDEVIKSIEKENYEVICVDASLAMSKENGSIKIEQKGIVPACFTNSAEVGNISIKGLTDSMFHADRDIVTLQATSIAYIILEAERRLKRLEQRKN